MGAAFKAGLCRSENCRAAIFWALTPSSTMMPIDIEPTDDGLVVIHPDDLRSASGDPIIRRIEQPGAMALDEPGEERYTSHFATCPDAKDFRRD
jgi:hypothetical protein